MADTSRDQIEAQQAAAFQAAVLAAVNAIGNPYVALHGLYELAGALASAMVRDDDARVEWTLGMTDALRARIERDATAALPTTSTRH